MPVTGPQPRQRSFRFRVRVGLVGVVVVTLPLIVLTLHYLRQIRNTSDAVAARAAVLLEIEELRTSIVGLTVPDSARLSADDRQRLERTLSEAADRARAIMGAYPAHLASLGRFIERCTAGVRDIEAWYAAGTAVGASGPPGPDPAHAQPLAILPADDSAWLEDVLDRRARVLADAVELDAALGAVAASILDAMGVEAVTAEDTVAHADRNLVTLALLALLAITLLLLVLPEALVEPIRRLTRTIRATGAGRPGGVVEAASDDELGALAIAVNETIETLRGFDALKRDRIIEDGGKIEALLRHAGGPAALLNSQLVVEAANREFLSLFGQRSSEEEVPLPDALGRSGEALSELLLRVRDHRHEVVQVLELATLDGKTRSWQAVVDVCRDRRARPTHLLVILRSEPTA